MPRLAARFSLALARSTAVLALFALFSSPLACGGGEDTVQQTQTPCAPSSTQSCYCADGRQGSQACAGDGTKFGDCACEGAVPNRCTPGASAACTCSNGKSGSQTCKADGTFDACACTSPEGGDGQAGDAGDSGPGLCVPGATVVCTCTTGKTGAQTCKSDGSYDVCVCTTPEGGVDGCAACVDGGACIDLDYDIHNCGACGHDCTALANVDTNAVFCSAGACHVPASSCLPGFAHCTSNADDGCETDITAGANCGGCGNVCAAGDGGSEAGDDGGASVCSMVATNVWACTSGCAGGTPTLCSGSCTDLVHDVQNCGACGHDCTALANVDPSQVFCVAGACKVPPNACKPGYGHCTGNVDDGCETDLTTNASCGACGTACATDAGAGTCSKNTQGVWACSNGCGGATPTSCGGSCTDTGSDPKNCGSCGHDCTAAPNAAGGALCVAGACVYTAPTGCASGFADCDGIVANGCESDVTTASRCGACNVSCGGPSPKCLKSGGAYTCTGDCTGATPDQCSGACTDYQTDAHNCGSCGHDCTKLAHVAGSVACVAGACVVPAGACQPGYAHCTSNVNDGCETDTTTPLACGGCGVTCSGGTPLCAQLGGVWQCSPACSGATPTACGGACVDLLTNGANCGSCGKSCTGGQSCVGGVCTCPTGYANCGTSGCRDIANDVNACGACGVVCANGQTCASGSCKCLGSRTVCSNTCVDTLTDSTNCGACSTVCAGGQVCTNGACACLSGQKLCGGVCKSVTADNANCGFCGLACASGQVCSGGVCTDPALAEIDAAGDLSCALRNSGQLACWGNGIGISSKSSPVVLNAPTDATQFSLGTSHACAVRPSGKVSCWGTGSSGQLGNGASVDSATPVDVAGITDAKQVAAGTVHSCVLRANGSVMCWGDNQYGELGNGTTASQNTPVTVSGLTNVAEIVTSYYFSCALTSAGAVYCWGYNGYGQLGDGTATPRGLANTAVSFVGSAKSIAAGSQHVCAALTTGQVTCWGYGAQGQLGNGAGATSYTPVTAQGLTDATSIDAGDLTTCAVRAGGSLVCWGYNTSGQFGNGTEVSSLVPIPAAGTRADIEQVAVGASHACIRRQDKSIECFGADNYGQLGDGANRVRTSPVQANGYCHAFQTNCSGFCFDLQSDPANCGGCGVACQSGQACNAGVCGCSDGLSSCGGVCRNLSSDVNNCGGCGTKCAAGKVCANGTCSAMHVTGLEASNNLTCAVENGGAVRCWGTGTGIAKNTPVLWGAPSDAKAVAVGSAHACAIRNSGQTVCWGTNASGQVGNGTVADSANAVPVLGLPNDAIQVAAGYAHSCALRAGGTIACWGDNQYGELGDGTAVGASAAVAVTGIADAVEIAAGYYFTCARRASGQVTCWGYNGYGNLGVGTANNTVLAGTPVSFLADAAQLSASAGAVHVCAVRTTGAVSCWGYGPQGELGNNASATSYTPVAVSNLSDAKQVYVYDRGTCALRANGTVTCWGDNASGQFGNGTTTSSPVPTPGGLGIANATRVANGTSHGCARRADDSVWCWGSDASGQLGDGLARIRTTPVEVQGYCTSGETSCSGACVNVASDPANCGSCGNACATGQACVAGACTCGVGQTSCSGLCKNLTSDTNNCGSCGNKCAAGQVCANGTCAAPAVAEISAYANLSCAVSNGGSVGCWGSGVGVTSASPVTLNLPVDARHVSVGAGFACAIRNGGQTVCWGANASGQLGNGTTADSAAPVAVVGLTDATQISAGYSHVCARRATGQVACWGDGQYGELGDGTTAGASTPITVTGINDAVQVVALYYSSCAVRATGVVTCWGYNGYGELGVGNTTNVANAGTPVSGVSDAVGISGNNVSVCAVRSSGAVACWGYNAQGQLGDGSVTTSYTPVVVSGLGDAASVTTSERTSCAVRTTGRVACWGDNASGQFGNGTTTSSPTQVAGASGILDARQLAIGTSHSCVLRADNSIDCFGSDANGQLGDGKARIRTTPVEVVGYCTTGETNCTGACKDLQNDPSSCGACGNACAAGQACVTGVCGCAIGTTSCSGTCRNLSSDSNNCGVCGTVCGSGKVCANGTCAAPAVADLEAYGNLTCALRNSGAVSCWGAGVGVSTSTPMPLVAPTDARDVAIGASHACAVRNSGQVVCWGSNAAGQLGNGTVTDSSIPVTVSGLSGATTISAGYAHSCARLSNGRVSCWGDGTYGQMGDGTAAGSNTPILVTGLTDAVDVVSAYYFSCALRSTGEVNCWGYNGYGTLGDNTTTNRTLANTPVLFLNDAVQVSASASTVCAVRSTGAVVCWGYGAQGQLGNNASSTSYVPVLVQGVSDAAEVSVHDRSACAARVSGAIVCWGDNANGNFGNNTLTSTTTATAGYSGLSSALEVVVGTSHSCARFSNNVVACSGSDANGQLGDAQATSQKLPVSTLTFP